MVSQVKDQVASQVEVMVLVGDILEKVEPVVMEGDMVTQEEVQVAFLVEEAVMEALVDSEEVVAKVEDLVI